MRCLPSMPLTWRSRACAKSCASRWPARSGCNGGVTCSPAGAGERSRPTRSHPPCSRPWRATGYRGNDCRLTIAARRFDLYDEPMVALADLEGYAQGASSSLIALAAKILNGAGEPDIDALSRHAGLAYAFAGLLKAFPFHAARGQLFLPLELLERHGADRRGRPGPGERRRNCARHWRTCVAAPAVISAARRNWRKPRRRPRCRRCCRSRWRDRRSRAWNGATTIRSCRSRSRPGAGSG